MKWIDVTLSAITCVLLVLGTLVLIPMLFWPGVAPC